LEKKNQKENIVNESGSSSGTAMTNVSPSLTKKLLLATDPPQKLLAAHLHKNSSDQRPIMEESLENYASLTCKNAQENKMMNSNLIEAYSQTSANNYSKSFQVKKSQSCILATYQNTKSRKDDSLCQMLIKMDKSKPLHHSISSFQSFV